MFNKQIFHLIRFLVASLLTGYSIFGQIITSHAASRLTVPIFGGNITVDNMSSISQTRIIWLVQIADRSTCRTDPLVGDCDGFMSPGDRIVIGDNYMAFMDLTRNSGISGLWGGGGGLLRGLWLLVVDGAGNKNFKYQLGTENFAPNNLFPKQLAPFSGDNGDAHELILIYEGGIDPPDSFRASESQSVNLLNDGLYNSTVGWEHYYYQFQGAMTQGNGSNVPYGDNINIGTSLGYSKANYRLQYWFFNRYYPGTNDNNSFLIQVRASIDICNTTGCNATRSLNTFVSSMGFSMINLGGKSNPNL